MVMAATSGRKLQGRLAILDRSAGDGGRHGLSQDAGVGMGRTDEFGRIRSTSFEPLSDSGERVAIAARSVAPTPSRSMVPVIDPADDPTMMSAERGSHPEDSYRAERTPAW
jgi:hypothetical protein